MTCNPKILIIDNEPWWPVFCRQVLTKHGFNIVVTPDKEEGLRLLDENQYDVVLLDLLKREDDGFSTLRDILKKHPNEKVIMVSAIDFWKDARDAYRYGAKDFLDKSFDKKRLFETVKYVLKMKDKKAVER